MSTEQIIENIEQVGELSDLQRIIDAIREREDVLTVHEVEKRIEDMRTGRVKGLTQEEFEVKMEELRQEIRQHAQDKVSP